MLRSKAALIAERAKAAFGGDASAGQDDDPIHEGLLALT
jgi:hypothetical protein